MNSMIMSGHGNHAKPPPGQQWLWEIVANERNGIDVDKVRCGGVWVGGWAGGAAGVAGVAVLCWLRLPTPCTRWGGWLWVAVARVQLHMMAFADFCQLCWRAVHCWMAAGLTPSELPLGPPVEPQFDYLARDSTYCGVKISCAFDRIVQFSKVGGREVVCTSGVTGGMPGIPLLLCAWA